MTLFLTDAEQHGGIAVAIRDAAGEIPARMIPAQVNPKMKQPSTAVATNSQTFPFRLKGAVMTKSVTSNKIRLVYEDHHD